MSAEILWTIDVLLIRYRGSSKSYIHNPDRSDGLTTSPTKRTIMVADWTVTKCRGAVNDALVMFGELKKKIDFLVVQGVPVRVLIQIPEMEGLSAQIYLGGKYVYFTIGRNSVRVAVKPDHSLKKPAGDESEDEDFTTNLSDASSEDEPDGDSEGSMVVALAVKEEVVQSQEELSNEEKVQKLKLVVAKKISHSAAMK